jgi:hypothetical protein
LCACFLSSSCFFSLNPTLVSHSPWLLLLPIKIWQKTWIFSYVFSMWNVFFWHTFATFAKLKIWKKVL